MLNNIAWFGWGVVAGSYFGSTLTIWCACAFAVCYWIYDEYRAWRNSRADC